MERPFTGKRALVTGSSRGIGRAIAVSLAARGAEVIVHCREDYGQATQVADEISARQILVADLAQETGITTVAEAVQAPLHILVNNAGFWTGTPLGGTEPALVQSMLDLNVKSVFLLTQALLPKLADGASIVNISSTAARVGNASGRSLYGATKAAVDALTRSWALELASRNIRVNAVAPGYVETDMTREHFSKPEVRKHALERHPFGRLGVPQDIADVVALLCSDEARWITGQSINASGGFVI